MTTAALTTGPALPSMGPRPRPWSKAEYHQMGELGWFVDQRVELLEGEIVEMPVPGNPHCISIDNVAEALREIFPRDKFWVRMQMPLDLGLDTEPQPDVAVVAGPKESYVQHPTTALLVVEVSDSTLAIDRGRKAALYARAGIADYWIVNLVDRQLEVLRLPIQDVSMSRNSRFTEMTIKASSELVSPVASAGSSIKVIALLN